MRGSARTSQWSALNAIGAIRVTAIVLRADFRCAWCGCRVPKGKRHVDHVVPRAEGGTDVATNLVLACDGCNTGRVGDGIPSKALNHGRTRREIRAEIRRQTRIDISLGTELYRRAAKVARLWYPEHFARKARARAAWCERQAFTFFEELAAA